MKSDMESLKSRPLGIILCDAFTLTPKLVRKDFLVTTALMLIGLRTQRPSNIQVPLLNHLEELCFHPFDVLVCASKCYFTNEVCAGIRGRLTSSVDERVKDALKLIFLLFETFYLFCVRRLCSKRLSLVTYSAFINDTICWFMYQSMLVSLKLLPSSPLCSTK